VGPRVCQTRPFAPNPPLYTDRMVEGVWFVQLNGHCHDTGLHHVHGHCRNNDYSKQLVHRKSQVMIFSLGCTETKRYRSVTDSILIIRDISPQRQVNSKAEINRATTSCFGVNGNVFSSIARPDRSQKPHLKTIRSMSPFLSQRSAKSTCTAFEHLLDCATTAILLIGIRVLD
jgi:hypothetical protein